MSEKKTASLIFVAGFAVTSLLFLDLCNAIYQCGCRSLWAGADAHCNVHKAGVKHCPLCSIGNAGFGAVFAAVIAVQAGISFRLRRWTPPRRLAACFAAFPLVTAAVALPLGLARNYWN